MNCGAIQRFPVTGPMSMIAKGVSKGDDGLNIGWFSPCRESFISKEGADSGREG